jgi:hypothetical protein
MLRSSPMSRGIALGMSTLLTLVTTGCITGFKHPLGPVSQSHVDEILLGTWSCRATDDDNPVALTFLDFDGRQYYVHLEDQKSDPQSLRAVATKLNDASFLSLRFIGPQADAEWTVVQYTQPDPGRLKLSNVAPEAFEDVLDEPQAIRDRLAGRLEDPEVISDFIDCTRPEASQKEAVR